MHVELILFLQKCAQELKEAAVSGFSIVPLRACVHTRVCVRHAPTTHYNFAFSLRNFFLANFTELQLNTPHVSSTKTHS